MGVPMGVWASCEEGALGIDVVRTLPTGASAIDVERTGGRCESSLRTGGILTGMALSLQKCNETSQLLNCVPSWPGRGD